MNHIAIDWKHALLIEGSRKKQYYETEKDLEELKKKISDAESMLNEDQYVYKYFHSRKVGLVLFLVMLVIVFFAGVSFFSVGMSNSYYRYSSSSMTSSFITAILTPVVILIIWIAYRIHGKKLALKEYNETYIPEQRSARDKIEIWKEEIEEKESALKEIKDEFVFPLFIHPYLRRLYNYLDSGRANSLQEAIENLIEDFNIEKERDTFKRNLREFENQLEQQKLNNENSCSINIANSEVGGEV